MRTICSDPERAEGQVESDWIIRAMEGNLELKISRVAINKANPTSCDYFFFKSKVHPKRTMQKTNKQTKKKPTICPSGEATHWPSLSGCKTVSSKSFFKHHFSTVGKVFPLLGDKRKYRQLEHWKMHYLLFRHPLLSKGGIDNIFPPCSSLINQIWS